MNSVDQLYYNKYMTYKQKYLQLKNQKKIKQMKGGDNKSNELYLFKAEWCGHCRNFKPTWDALQNTMKDNIKFITYDADKDKSVIKQYKIDGFPTLMMKTKDDRVIEYVGERDINGLMQFINSYTK
jgi:thiol-disulfide isomerase/thioredoxin